MTLLAGKYELGELLYRGPRHDVLSARREGEDDELVVKLRHPSRDALDGARAEVEVAVVTFIRSPAVVRIVDHGEADGRFFVVMERVRGAMTLADSLSRIGPLAPRRALPILYQLVRGVDDIHRSAVAHRNLRADKVLLSPNADRPPRVFIAGLGRALHETSPDAKGGKLRTAMRADLAALGPIFDAVVDPKARPDSFERILDGIRDYFDARALLDHLTRSLLLDAPMT